MAEARARRSAERRTRVRPVVVDESGRRHRLARLAALGAGMVVAVFLAVVALASVGAPGCASWGRRDAGVTTGDPAGGRATSPEPATTGFGQAS